MFFILSKTLDFLLSPFIWALAILIYAFFSKRSVATKKKIYLAGLIVLLFFSNSFLVNEAFLCWERTPVSLDNGKNYRAAIILTGFTGSRKSTPGRVFFNKGADRLLHTVQLYKEGRIRTIIVSGGSGSLTKRKISEAAQVKKALLYCGIPDSAIVIESRSHNTVENARLSRKLIDSLGLRGNFLLVTSAFHMRRAEGCFKKAGVRFDPYPVDVYSNDKDFSPDDFLLPSETALYKWSILIHEITGYVVYRMMGYV